MLSRTKLYSGSQIPLAEARLAFTFSLSPPLWLLRAAVASCFRHSLKDADWLWNAKTT